MRRRLLCPLAQRCKTETALLTFVTYQLLLRTDLKSNNVAEQSSGLLICSTSADCTNCTRGTILRTMHQQLALFLFFFLQCSDHRSGTVVLTNDQLHKFWNVKLDLPAIVKTSWGIVHEAATLFLYTLQHGHLASLALTEDRCASRWFLSINAGCCPIFCQDMFVASPLLPLTSISKTAQGRH